MGEGPPGLRRGARSRRAGGRTPRSCSTRRGRPAMPKGVVLSYDNLVHTSRAYARARGAARRRGGPRLPADGLDRPEPLLLRAVAGDRASASTARSPRKRSSPTCARSGPPTTSRRRGCWRRCSRRSRSAWRTPAASSAGSTATSWRVARQRGRAHPRRAGGLRPRPAALRARRALHLRAAAQFARHVADPRGLHRGRGHRPRPLRLLPVARHQPEADLRPDRDLRDRSACSPTGR